MSKDVESLLDVPEVRQRSRVEKGGGVGSMELFKTIWTSYEIQGFVLSKHLH